MTALPATTIQHPQCCPAKPAAEDCQLSLLGTVRSGGLGDGLIRFRIVNAFEPFDGRRLVPGRRRGHQPHLGAVCARARAPGLFAEQANMA